MRCVSCGADIPPAFVHAIQANICAGCGGPIMDERQKELLDELSSAMQRMPNDPQGLAGWLLSNYRFQKIGSAEPVERFHRKGGSAAPIDESNLKIAPDYERFLKRTGEMGKVQETLAKVAGSKNSKLAQLAAEIQGGVDDEEDPLPSSLEEVDEQMDREDINTMKALQAAGINPFTEYAGRSAKSSTKGGPSLADSEISKLVAYANKLSFDDLLPEEKEIASSERGQAVLRKERIRRIKAQNAINGDGPIRRSGD